MRAFKLVDRDGRDLGTVGIARPNNPPGVVIPGGTDRPSPRVVEARSSDVGPVLVVEPVTHRPPA